MLKIITINGLPNFFAIFISGFLLIIMWVLLFQTRFLSDSTKNTVPARVLSENSKTNVDNFR